MLQKFTFWYMPLLAQSQNTNMGTLHENIGSLETLIDKRTVFGNRQPDDATLVHLPNAVNIHTLLWPNIYYSDYLAFSITGLVAVPVFIKKKTLSDPDYDSII